MLANNKIALVCKVYCNGDKKKHTIIVTRKGQLVLANHTRSNIRGEMLIKHLGGITCNCIRILNAWQSNNLDVLLKADTAMWAMRRNMGMAKSDVRNWRKYSRKKAGRFSIGPKATSLAGFKEQLVRNVGAISTAVVALVDEGSGCVLMDLYDEVNEKATASPSIPRSRYSCFSATCFREGANGTVYTGVDINRSVENLPMFYFFSVMGAQFLAQIRSLRRSNINKHTDTRLAAANKSMSQGLKISSHIGLGSFSVNKTNLIPNDGVMLGVVTKRIRKLVEYVLKSHGRYGECLHEAIQS